MTDLEKPLGLEAADLIRRMTAERQEIVNVLSALQEFATSVIDADDGGLLLGSGNVPEIAAARALIARLKP